MDADKELIQEFLEGDLQSFNRLVLKYQQKVINLCFRYMGQRAEAEDVAQEVFLTLYKSLGQFRGDSLFSTWIFRITVNHCKNRLKYLSRRNYYQNTSIDQAVQTQEGEINIDVVEEGAGPEELLLSNEVQDMVQSQINELDPDHRLAIVLRDIQGLSYHEIADILELKEGTVKSRIHRARMELKEKLEKIIDL